MDRKGRVKSGSGHIKKALRMSLDGVLLEAGTHLTTRISIKNMGSLDDTRWNASLAMKYKIDVLFCSVPGLWCPDRGPHHRLLRTASTLVLFMRGRSQVIQILATTVSRAEAVGPAVFERCCT